MEKDTMAYQLAVLRDTQMVQRRLLEKQFPYIDWERMPFSSYGDFFRLRGILDNCGAVWTNAYGRSNDEADGKRKYLTDYSGNGRDIELFNFGWTEDSGYNTTTYPGAIVGDGVDDYGQCVKDFALPDDYTVVAMREQLGNNQTPLLAKSHSSGEGAFHFDATDAISYAYNNTIIKPQLFSYQSKTSYNGTTIIAGRATDTVDDKLFLFKTREESTSYKEAALYSFGIFTRTLTEDELRVVENCMYAEWIAMTGKLEDIEYYDILDARFRSNDEAADKRNRWVGRLGRLHMTLHNYAYSQMSGWDGWPLPKQCTFSVAKNSSNYWLGYMGAPASVKTNSWGIRIVSNPTGDPISLIYISLSNTAVKTIALNEGVVNIIPPMTEDFANLAFSLPNHPVGSVVEFEQIPLYGGALVSDGVDDYAVSDEVIGEEIGGIVSYGEEITSVNGAYFFNAGQGTDNANRIYFYRDNSGKINIGRPGTDTELPIASLKRTPLSPDDILYLFCRDVNANMNNAALYQLRLIKNQPTDIQLEAIKWQCRKEHEDYLIHRGWKEVE